MNLYWQPLSFSRSDLDLEATRSTTTTSNLGTLGLGGGLGASGGALGAGATEVLVGGTSGAATTEEDGLGTSGALESELIESEDLTTSGDNASTGSVGDAEGAHLHLGELGADVISDAANDNDDAVILL